MKRQKRIALSLLITVVFGAIGYYIALPPLNAYSEAFWISLAVLGVVFTVANALLSAKGTEEKSDSKGGLKKLGLNLKRGEMKYGLIVTAIPIAILLIGTLISATVFNAQKYADIITVEEAVFEEDMPETDTVTNIALMDTDSAIIIGNRTLGSLSNVVSQFRISDYYTQINLNKAPAKVSNLEYDDFFKWLNNRQTGVPGYVWVDPVRSDAEYIPLDEPMKYVESGYFSEDLDRKLRFSYPTKIFEGAFFEIDEEGNPYYIAPCMAPKVGLFGAMDVSEVVIFNPVDGTSELYALEDTPAWVDNVFNGQLASQKYDWYGTLHKGFWNSVIGNKDCRVTTDDFGYIVLGDDVWYFTGVTSVSADESNIGFIISNARTGEYKYYPVIGAEEYSAMSAAQGDQAAAAAGYVASFPSLINVAGEATYIMVLKDSGIVRMYALVNVENYSIVATGSTQTEAKEKYLELLYSNGVLEREEEKPDEPVVETKTATVTVADVRFVTVDGNSVVYLTGEDKVLYRLSVADNESVMLIGVGDKLDVTYADTDTEKIKQIVSFTWKTEG